MPFRPAKVKSKSKLKFTAILLLALLIGCGACTGDDPDSGKVVVYRDEYGVPHIYAPTIEAGAYTCSF